MRDRHHHEALVNVAQTVAGSWSSIAILGPAAIGVGVKVVQAVRLAWQTVRRGDL